MKKKIVDVLPGELFEMPCGLDSVELYKPSYYNRLGLFLKLSEQKAVNLLTYICFKPSNQQLEVEVKAHPLDSYLFVSNMHNE